MISGKTFRLNLTYTVPPSVVIISLKQDNAEMLASIDEIDGGLIALTRFQGEIGYYPEEYLEIIRLYMGKVNNR